MTREADAALMRVRNLVLAGLAFCLLMQAWLACTLEINWDEFFFLSLIYDFQRGEMVNALQSLHVHLLGWITLLPGNEVDQIIAGRFVMLGFLIGNCVLIYRLAREHFSPFASAIAVLAFASAGPTIIHGASFRADPISAFFIMLSLVTLARGTPSFRTMLLAGASAAVAAMITIKVGLYAPAFLGFVIWRSRDQDERSRVLKWLAGTALTAAVIFAGIYLVQLGLVEKSSNGASQAMLGNAARTALFNTNWAFVAGAAKIATIQALFLAIGAIGVAAALVRARGEERYRLVAIAGCGATLLCVLFYRNAYPYFFPFIMPPAMLLVAWVIDRFAVLQRPLWLGVLMAAFLLPALMVGASWAMFRDRPPQRQVVEAVHRIFPRPVPMIDQSHVIGSFPKPGIFMSTWGVRKYREGRPIFADILAHEAVPLLLIDGPVLEEAVGIYDPTDTSWPLELPLLVEDRMILRQNYVPYWGPIWVAGKRIDQSERKGDLEILIPGRYVLGGKPIVLDDRPVPAGGLVSLSRGMHRFDVVELGARTLRWADVGARPAEPAPTGHLFSQFFGWAAPKPPRGPARP